jgi:hypothetical protein
MLACHPPVPAAHGPALRRRRTRPATPRAVRAALGVALTAVVLLGTVPVRAGPVAGAGGEPAPFEGRWGVVPEDLEDARRSISRVVRRVEPLVRGPARRRGGPGEGGLPSTLLQGLALPSVDLVIEDRGDSWVLIADGRDRRVVGRRAVVSRSSPIVRSGGVEDGDLIVETANDAGTRIVEHYRRAGPDRLLLDLRLTNALFDDPVEATVAFLVLPPDGAAPRGRGAP